MDDRELSQTVQTLLEHSRTRIESGDRDAALACLIQAITLTRGEAAVVEVLTAAKERYEASLPPRAGAGAGSGAGAGGGRAGFESQNREKARLHRQMLEMALQASEELVQRPSILADRDDGSEEILRDAFEDGSSVICAKCGGLVKQQRWEAHKKFWCSGNEAVDDEDDS